MLMRFKDSPEESMATPQNADKVMHAQFQIGDTTVMASDGRNTGAANFQGFALSIIAPTEVEASRLSRRSARARQVTMPLAKTFFSPRFGMLADQVRCKLDGPRSAVALPRHVKTTHRRARGSSGRRIMGGNSIGRQRQGICNRAGDRCAAAERLGRADQGRAPAAMVGSDRLRGDPRRRRSAPRRPVSLRHALDRGLQDVGAMFAYQDVVPPERLVFVNWFSNEAGGVHPNPIVPTWPLEPITTLQFGRRTGRQDQGVRHLGPAPGDRSRAEDLRGFTAEEGELGQQFRSARGLPDEGKLAGDRRLVRLRRKRGADDNALARLGGEGRRSASTTRTGEGPGRLTAKR